jgi:hypothetical protein
MGRNVLTGTSNRDALEFLYAHNGTHLLIDSTDIGKYSAFSFIGSDENLDRRSFISTFYRDPNRVQEKKNSTVFVYLSGIGLDEDISYEENGSKIFLPSEQSGLGGIYIERDTTGKIISPPIGIFVNQGQQYQIPFRYAFDGKSLIDFDSGLEAGVFVYPRAMQDANGVTIDQNGALLYLSKRTVKSQLARLYLYQENNSNFKLVHSEDDFLVAQVKAQNPEFSGDFIDYGGLHGPIRIWEINYPSDVEFKEEYLSTNYPEELRK